MVGHRERDKKVLEPVVPKAEVKKVKKAKKVKKKFFGK